MPSRTLQHRARSLKRGFSLLEVTIALSISGLLFSSLWQLTAVAGQQREVTIIADQVISISTAAKRYISNEAATLLALPQLTNLNSVARIKITDSDSGDTATSLLGLAYLPEGFVNLTGYNQNYALFVRREDSGTPRCGGCKRPPDWTSDYNRWLNPD